MPTSWEPTPRKKYRPSRLRPTVKGSRLPCLFRIDLPIRRVLYARAMMKSTFRLPTFTDCYYRRMGNPSLNPEKATLYDIGLTWNIGGHGVLKYLSVTADGYYNHVTDKIVAYPTTYIWRMANFGKVEAWGADVTLTSEIGLGQRMGLNALCHILLSKREKQNHAGVEYLRPATALHALAQRKRFDHVALAVGERGLQPYLLRQEIQFGAEQIRVQTGSVHHQRPHVLA